jgi:hypothetical protein
MDYRKSDALRPWITFAHRVFPGWEVYGFFVWALGSAAAFFFYQAEFGFAGRIVFGIIFAWAWLGILIVGSRIVRRR